MLSFDSVYFDDFVPNWHVHLEVLQINIIVLVIQGKVSYSINGNTIIAESGDLLFIPKNAEHEGKNYDSEGHQKFTVLFNSEDLENSFISFLRNQQFFKIKTGQFEYIQNRCERLYSEFKETQEHRSFICEGILQEVLGLMARELDKPKITPTKTRFVQILKQYILENYRENIEISQLAKLIHRSPNYTTFIFREVTGKSPIQYLHQLRIHKACNLLLQTDMTIASIASYLGYYDSSYFSRTFKRLTLKSPKQFMDQGTLTEISTFFS